MTRNYACGPYTTTGLLRVAAAAVSRQTHPLAHAIRRETETCQLTLPPPRRGLL